MAFEVELTGVANRWIIPGSNQHKILSYCRDKSLFESEAANMFSMHQGFHRASMFDFMAQYQLTDSIGHRYVSKCNDRGIAVVDLLDKGLAVNIRNMKTDKARATKFAEKSIMDKCNAKFGSHKYAIIAFLYSNPGKSINEVIKSIPYSEADHYKYCKLLIDSGLISIDTTGILNLTELGMLEYSEALKSEPQKYLNHVKARISQFYINFERARISTYSNPAVLIVDEVKLMLDFINSEAFNKYAGVIEAKHELLEYIIQNKSLIEKTIEENIDYDSYSEERKEAMVLNNHFMILKDIADIAKHNFILNLSTEVTNKLLLAKLKM